MKECGDGTDRRCCDGFICENNSKCGRGDSTYTVVISVLSSNASVFVDNRPPRR